MGTAATADKIVSESVIIAAEPEAIFEVLADPRRHCDFDGSGTVSGSMSGPKRLSLGASFGMKMRFGPLPYRISSKVKEFEENRRIAWAHFGGHRWRYELEAVEGGTRVTESFDWSTAMSPRFIERSGYPARNKAGIVKTLDRLKALIESGDSTE